MRTLQVFLLVLVVGILLAVWSPWNNWNLSITQFFGIEPSPEAAGLQVSSLAGTLEVYVDNVQVGTVEPESSPLVIPGITPGEKPVQLIRTSSTEGAFVEFNKLINFLSGVDVVISYELGPTDVFSEGHIISVADNNDSSETTFLNITSVPEGAKILIDGIAAGVTPLVLYPIGTSEQHVISLDAEGYEGQEFRLLPSEQSERDKIKGFTINVDAQLFLQPIQVR